jgi:tetratricopeptide (TPR) repeat protein
MDEHSLIPPGGAFTGHAVVFTGRLSSLARREAQALVTRLGGTAQDDVTAKTTMVVIGAAGFPGDAERRSRPREDDHASGTEDRSQKLRRAERLNAENPGRIRIIGEDEFCNLAGLQPPSALKQQYYAASDIRAMYPRLRDDHLRYLEKWNLVRPLLRTHAERYFGFQDLAIIRQVEADLERGVALGTAIRSVYAEHAGQLALDFRLDAEPARVIRLTRGAAPIEIAAVATSDREAAERLFLSAAALDDGSDEHRERAAQGYRDALEADPSLVPALINLANLSYAADHLAEAEALYEKAIALETDVFEAHFNLGNVHHDLGRFEEARRSYMRALALNPTYADGHFYLAVTLEKLGRSQEARPHWRAYQQLAPDGEWVTLAREFSD